MPQYVYRCEKCGHQFELIARMSDPNPTCPKVVEDPEAVLGHDGAKQECGHDCRKLIVGGTFHLKGSGWASDGYS